MRIFYIDRIYRVPQVGQFAKELGPVYTAYGKALLQLGIESKDNVLLNKAAIPESLVEGIAASTLPGGATDGKVKKTKIVNLDDVAFEGDEEVETGEAGDGSSDEQKANEPASGDDHSEVDGAEGGDDDELQLAWEVLDVARMIYADSASIDAVAKVRLADVHVDLGDVAMEMESFSQAADEFSKALELKVSSDEKAKNERDIASVYFKLAMALEYDGRPKEALFPLTTSLSLLKRRLEQLSGQVGDADDKGKEKTFADNPAPVGTDAEELNELQQLLPEVKDKLEDIRSQLRTEPIAQIEMQDSTALEVKAAVAAAAQGAIQDLSGLVRKRKSPQE